MRKLVSDDFDAVCTDTLKPAAVATVSSLKVASGSSRRSYLDALRQAHQRSRSASTSSVASARHVVEVLPDRDAYVDFYEETPSVLASEIQEMVSNVWEIPEKERTALKQSTIRKPRQPTRKTATMTAAESEWLQDDSLDIPLEDTQPSHSFPQSPSTKAYSSTRTPWENRQEQQFGRVLRDQKFQNRPPKRVRPPQVALTKDQPLYEEVKTYQEK